MRPLNQPIKFVLVSGLNTLFGYSVYFAFLFMNVNYSIALLFATVLGVLFNFNTIGKLVFSSTTRKGLTFFKFIAVYAFIYFFQLQAIELLQNAIPNFYIAGFLAMMSGALLAFILNKTFVFRSSYETH